MKQKQNRYDIVVIGTGPGGGTLAYSLRDSGARILLIERGDYIPREPKNWELSQMGAYYDKDELWRDEAGNSFQANGVYCVGGMTKTYGAALFRRRRSDFQAIEDESGRLVEWPIGYDDLEVYYRRAEEIYWVHGNAGEDPTEVPREPYAFSAIPHEPYVEDYLTKLQHNGLRPFHRPMGIGLRRQNACIRCRTCDGFPCQIHAKADAEVCCVRPALESPNVEILTRTMATRLITDSSGEAVTAVEVCRQGETWRIEADMFVVSGGAVNSAALLLRSATSKHSAGLANSSGLVGANLMQKNFSWTMAIGPEANPTSFAQTWAIHDFYLKRPGSTGVGSIQGIGKMYPTVLRALEIDIGCDPELVSRSVDSLVMTEALPALENRVTVGSDGAVAIAYRPTNLAAHTALEVEYRDILMSEGFEQIGVCHDPWTRRERAGFNQGSHQCGTVRFGADPTSSVLDLNCRAHDLKNLYVVDSSFFPTQGSVNPALTVMANALRVADVIKRTAA